MVVDARHLVNSWQILSSFLNRALLKLKKNEMWQKHYGDVECSQKIRSVPLEFV